MNVTLVDANAVGYNSNSAKRLSTSEDKPVQAIFHSIKFMWNLSTKFKQHTPLVLWDAHCQWRYDLYPEYKSKREEYEKQRIAREEYREQRPAIKEFFKTMGFRQLESRGYEADDIAGVYANKISAMPDSSAILVTGDKDWFQLVSENVSIFYMHKGEIIDLSNFKAKTGYDTTRQFIVAKAMHGDSSDTITGVGGIGEGTALKLMNIYGSMRNVIEIYKTKGEFTKENIHSDLSRVRNKVNSFCKNELGQWGILNRNLKLMDLSKIEPPKVGFYREHYEPDIDSFVELCLEYEFFSLADKAERIFNEIARK